MSRRSGSPPGPGAGSGRQEEAGPSSAHGGGANRAFYAQARQWLAHGSPRRRPRFLWPFGLALLAVRVGLEPHDRCTEAAARTGPVKIGALTQSWGQTLEMTCSCVTAVPGRGGSWAR